MSIANRKIPRERTLTLVDTADDLHVGDRPALVAPGDKFPWRIDVRDKAGDELHSVDRIVVVDIGEPKGSLSISDSEVGDGSVVLEIDASAAKHGDDWKVRFQLHPTSEQTINATVYVSARRPRAS